MSTKMLFPKTYFYLFLRYYCKGENKLIYISVQISVILSYYRQIKPQYSYLGTKRTSFYSFYCAQTISIQNEGFLFFFFCRD